MTILDRLHCITIWKLYFPGSGMNKFWDVFSTSTCVFKLVLMCSFLTSFETYLFSAANAIHCHLFILPDTTGSLSFEFRDAFFRHSSLEHHHIYIVPITCKIWLVSCVDYNSLPWLWISIGAFQWLLGKPDLTWCGRDSWLWLYMVVMMLSISHSAVDGNCTTVQPRSSIAAWQTRL